MRNAVLSEPILAFLRKKGLLDGDSDVPVDVRAMSGDGSTREFYRVQLRQRSVIITLPGDTGEAGKAEAESCWLIGEHLRKAGVSVPEILGYDREQHLLLYEDVGDRLLHHAVEETESPWIAGSEIVNIYRLVIEKLAWMQVYAAENFQAAWCWDTSCYNQQVMLEREAKYFLNAFCLDMLGLQWHEDVLEECREIARKASEASPQFFLHRDFQSRNIMLAGERVIFIDFQAGRFGPLGYDLASLLIDPYVAMPEEIQEQLIAHYLTAVANHVSLDAEVFTDQYRFLGLQRNLQIVGAFAFLSSVRGKTFFVQYLFPALASLEKRLSISTFNDFKNLKRLVTRSSAKLSRSLTK